MRFLWKLYKFLYFMDEFYLTTSSKRRKLICIDYPSASPLFSPIIVCTKSYGMLK